MNAVDTTHLAPDMRSDNKLRAHVERIRKAIQDEGLHPQHHRKQLERLRQDWPTLYNAIMGLLNEPQKGNPCQPSQPHAQS